MGVASGNGTFGCSPRSVRDLKEHPAGFPDRSTTVPTGEKQSFAMQMSWSSALALKLPATRVFCGVSMSHPSGSTPKRSEVNGSTYLAPSCPGSAGVPCLCSTEDDGGRPSLPVAADTDAGADTNWRQLGFTFFGKSFRATPPLPQPPRIAESASASREVWPHWMASSLAQADGAVQVCPAVNLLSWQDLAGSCSHSLLLSPALHACIQLTMAPFPQSSQT